MAEMLRCKTWSAGGWRHSLVTGSWAWGCAQITRWAVAVHEDRKKDRIRLATGSVPGALLVVCR